MPKLPTDAAGRKAIPLATGLVDYFPDALVAIAAVSKVGGEQHNPGQPLFWDRTKSTDEADTLMRHFVERGTLDRDGTRHSAKVAWRALALLQKEIEAERAAEEAEQDEKQALWEAEQDETAAKQAEWGGEYYATSCDCEVCQLRRQEEADYDVLAREERRRRAWVELMQWVGADWRP